jgi:hypothetical protein
MDATRAKYAALVFIPFNYDSRALHVSPESPSGDNTSTATSRDMQGTLIFVQTNILYNME